MTSKQAERAERLTLRELVVVDAAGRERIALRIGGNGEPEVALFDERGRARVCLRLLPARPAREGFPPESEGAPVVMVNGEPVRFR